MRERGCAIAPDRRLSDDGKGLEFTESDGRCIGRRKLEKGGSLREGGSKIAPDRRLADDGKRLYALDVVYRGDSYIKKRGVQRREGKKFCRSGGWRIHNCCPQAVDPYPCFSKIS